MGVRTPPLASSTKDLTISRSSFGVFSSSTDGGAWPDLVQRRSYDLGPILVHLTAAGDAGVPLEADVNADAGRTVADGAAADPAKS